MILMQVILGTINLLMVSVILVYIVESQTLGPMTMLNDNESAILIANNPKLQEKTKHI